MSQPVFSVVTISFNQAQYLEKAISSVLGQEGVALQYIVLDAASKDGSKAIIERHAPQLAYWASEKDGGPAAALNNGLRRCTGDYFCYLNSDDYFMPHAFRRAADLFEAHPEIDVIFGGTKIEDADGKVTRRGRVSYYHDMKDLVNGSFLFIQQGTFFRREFLVRHGLAFNEANRTCWDGEFALDALLAGARALVVGDHFAVFRLHHESMTGSGQQALHLKVDGPKLRQKAEQATGLKCSRLEYFWRQVRFRASPLRRYREYFGGSPTA